MDTMSLSLKARAVGDKPPQTFVWTSSGAYDCIETR